MKIATWNVNSLRVRLQHVLDWLDSHRPDVIGLQETKMPDHEFPADAFSEAGYGVRFAGQKTYNGVALVFREDEVGAPTDLVTAFAGHEDSQKRVIAGTFGSLRVYNLYVPNGQSVGSEKYEYKLDWLGALRAQLETEIAAHDQIVVMGDFNIAPEDRDIHDPVRWRGKIMCSDAERDRLAAVTGLGFEDVFRRFDQPEGIYSWWDYRMGAFRRNNGLRIDLILMTADAAQRCAVCEVDREPRARERPSDHAPVWAELAPASG